MNDGSTQADYFLSFFSLFCLLPFSLSTNLNIILTFAFLCPFVRSFAHFSKTCQIFMSIVCQSWKSTKSRYHWERTGERDESAPLCSEQINTTSNKVTDAHIKRNLFGWIERKWSRTNAPKHFFSSLFAGSFCSVRLHAHYSISFMHITHCLVKPKLICERNPLNVHCTFAYE